LRNSSKFEEIETTKVNKIHSLSFSSIKDTDPLRWLSFS